MTEPDKGNGEEIATQAQRVADYLGEHSIDVVGVSDGQTDTYSFMPADGEPLEFNVHTILSYDSRSGRVIPASPDEIERRDRIPGFKDIVDEFGQILARSGGDFYSEEFRPIHDALDALN